MKRNRASGPAYDQVLLLGDKVEEYESLLSEDLQRLIDARRGFELENSLLQSFRDLGFLSSEDFQRCV